MKLQNVLKNIPFTSSMNLKKNSTLRNLFIVGSITLFVKLLGFYKETFVAANFGLSLALDTYFIAALVPGFIQNVFLGAFKSVFIPNYIMEMKTGKNIGSFQSTGFIITLLVSVFFLLIAFLLTDTYLEYAFPGQTENYYYLIKTQFYILAPCIIIWGISSLLGGLLNISNEFLLSSLPGLFIPLFIILSLVFFKKDFGVYTLSIGTLIGSIVTLVFLFIIAQKKNILNFGMPNFKNKNVKLMFQQVPSKVTSGLLTNLNPVIDQFFAAQLLVGSITAINYGLKVPSFLMGILVIAISNVLLPKFSKMLYENRERTYQIFLKIIKYLFVISGFITIIGVFLSDYMIALFFERKEFTSNDTATVAQVQKIFLIYVPFAICGMVIVNFLTSMNKNSIMAYVSAIAIVINFVLDYILIKYYGIYGIAICTTVVVIIKNIILYNFAIKEIKKNR